MTGAPHSRRGSTFARAKLLAVISSMLAVGAWSDSASAQPGLGGGGPAAPGGQGQAPGQRSEKKDGPAEAAPKDKEALRPIEPVPAQPQGRRRVQLFDLHGYMRMRGDYFHRLTLGLDQVIGEGDQPTKFFRPPAESQETNEDGDLITQNQASCINRLSARGVSFQRVNTRCNRREGIASANLRLRLEPTFHITDTVSVHSQVDLLDNVVLGSTPDSYLTDNPAAPIDLFTRSQVPPQNGQNSLNDSIVVKRAWGDIRFGWGLRVEFGRMPWSWGMGLVANHGNGYARGEKADIIRHLDRDYGDSLDSLKLSFDFGKDRRRTHTLSVSWDWAASGGTTGQLLGREYESGGTVGQALSVEKFDNVYQWSVSIQRRDDMPMLKRKLSLGSPVLNYGFISWVRYQDIDDAAFSDPTNLQEYTNRLVERRAIVASPDLWFRVNWRTLRVELELAGNFGVFRLRDLDLDVEQSGGDAYYDNLDRSGTSRRTLANFGYALEFKYGFFQDRFHIGFDQGMASGDTAAALDSNALSPLNQNDNNVVSNFRFNPAYNIDLLLFREILGTVSNAVYFKPWAAFYFFDHFSARVDIEYAMAARRQATLGNLWSYGIEIDAAARYHDTREPIFFQLQYGVMFPLGAFNRLRVSGGREDARAVQSFQAQLGIRF